MFKTIKEVKGEGYKVVTTPAEPLTVLLFELLGWLLSIYFSPSINLISMEGKAI